MVSSALCSLSFLLFKSCPHLCFICVPSVAKTISSPPQESPTLSIRGKSTTCVEKGGKRRVKPGSKWEKLHHFPIFCPPFPRLTHIPDHLFPPLTASRGSATALVSVLGFIGSWFFRVFCVVKAQRRLPRSGAIKSPGSRFARLLIPKIFGVGFKTQLHVASFPPLLPPTPTP
jgi:hypothetical protein